MNGHGGIPIGGANWYNSLKKACSSVFIGMIYTVCVEFKNFAIENNDHGICTCSTNSALLSLSTDSRYEPETRFQEPIHSTEQPSFLAYSTNKKACVTMFKHSD